MSESQFFPAGRTVLCDCCNKDWTDLDGVGGFLFGSWAVCPECAPNFMKDVKKHGEEHFVKGTCPSTKSFADWIREGRGPNAGITITKL